MIALHIDSFALWSSAATVVFLFYYFWAVKLSYSRAHERFANKALALFVLFALVLLALVGLYGFWYMTRLFFVSVFT